MKNFINIFSFNVRIVLVSCSTKVTFPAPLDKHSIPKDPIPEYRSKIFEFSMFTLIRFE